MSNSNGTDSLMKDQDLLPSQPAQLDDESILDRIMSADNSEAQDSQHSAELERSSDSPVLIDSSDSAADPKNDQSVGVNISSNTVDSLSNPAVKDKEDLANTRDVSAAEGESNIKHKIVGIIKSPGVSASSEASSVSETDKGLKNTSVPEIVPNSETHVSDVVIEDPDISPMETEEVDGSESREQLSTINVKEEILDDDSTEDPQDANSCSSFVVSSSFEVNLDPKFKPTIMLEKINVNSGVKAEGEDAEGLSDINAHSSEETASDEEDHQGNPSGRPRRSIKTPRRFLTNGYALSSKKLASKFNKTVGNMVGSKSPSKNKPIGSIINLDRTKTISKEIPTSTNVVKTKSNFVPIKPKPTTTAVKVNLSNDGGKSQSIVIVPSKSTLKAGQELQSKPGEDLQPKPVVKPGQDVQLKLGLKTGQDLQSKQVLKTSQDTQSKPGLKVSSISKTPIVKKPSSTNDYAKSLVRSLNADSVPGILKRSKRKADGEESTSPTESDSPKGGTPTSSITNQSKKQKVEPMKKPPPRRHKKIFDYESYLKEHLETEVNDKKPNGGVVIGEPFQLLSSLVGVNISPSKIKVLPFTNNSNNALKSSLVENKKTNEVSNVRNNGQKDRTLYDLMQDISHMLPSWNLHVLSDSRTFCIAQVSRGRSGIPTLKTSIELDSQFNAKVFIHQLHCKRYDGVYDSEESISALIQEIEALSK